KGSGKIAVYDVTGRSVRQEVVVKNDKIFNAAVDMNNLVAGLYVVEIKIGDTYKLTKSILKK
ncbi:MAG: T9SS type A sorting domain-containing protein, partial [Chitinophagaceae bacterium]